MIDHTLLPLCPACHPWHHGIDIRLWCCWCLASVTSPLCWLSLVSAPAAHSLLHTPHVTHTSNQVLQPCQLRLGVDADDAVALANHLSSLSLLCSVGLTRLNVYAGMAGLYFLRNLDATQLATTPELTGLPYPPPGALLSNGQPVASTAVSVPAVMLPCALVNQSAYCAWGFQQTASPSWSLHTTSDPMPCSTYLALSSTDAKG